jgi:hypothetical protein
MMMERQSVPQSPVQKNTSSGERREKEERRIGGIG